MFIIQKFCGRSIAPVIVLLLCLTCAGQTAMAQQSLDPGQAMENMLARLAAKREAKANQAAKQALQAADRLVSQSATQGFARAFEQRIVQLAAAIRQQLGQSQDESTAGVHSVQALNDALRAYRQVASFPSMHVVKATAGTFTFATHTQDQWADGLLVDVQAKGGRLVLVNDQVVELKGERQFVETTLLTREFPEDDQVTISFWLYPTSTQNNMEIIEGNIAGKYNRWQINYTQAQQMALLNNGPQSVYTFTTPGSVPAGQWTHVSMTYGKGDEILPALYVNGLFAGEQNEHRDYPLGNKRDKPLLFGSNYQRYLESHFMLRDVRIWRGIRSVNQIQDDMFGSLTGNETGLLGYWPLNDGQGKQVMDKSPLAHHGTLHGGQWSPRVQAGYRLSQPIALDALSTITSSRVTWQNDVRVDGVQVNDAQKDNTPQVLIHAGLSDSQDQLPTQWQQAENGKPIAALEPGRSVRGQYLWIKQTLVRPTRDGKSPGLRALTLEMTGR